MTYGPDPAFAAAPSSRCASRPSGLQSGVKRRLLSRRFSASQQPCSRLVTRHDKRRRSGDGDARSPALLCRCSSKVEHSPRKVEMSVQVRPLAPNPSSSNGRTLGFGPRSRGSNPCEGTTPSWRNRIAHPASNREAASSNLAEGAKVQS
jgi:hypothetical protein